MTDQEAYGNGFERTVLGKDDDLDPEVYAREISRYRYASAFVKPGMSVLEFGCSSGFGTRLLDSNIQYTGVDYDKKIVDYARDNFSSLSHHFLAMSIEEFLEKINDDSKWDVIIAFEVLEHVKDGREVAKKLKKYCSTLLCTVPYNEPVGFWGPHHVLHGLKEADFPEFGKKYMRVDGQISSSPGPGSANLMMLTWQEGKEYADRKRVLACVPTRYRYDGLMQTATSA